VLEEMRKTDEDKMKKQKAKKKQAKKKSVYQCPTLSLTLSQTLGNYYIYSCSSSTL